MATLKLLRMMCLVVTSRVAALTFTVRSDTYIHAGLDDRSFSEDVAFGRSANRTVTCAVLCNRNPSCLTFTLAQGQCRGHSAAMTSNSTHSVVTGAKSFIATGSEEWCRKNGLQLMNLPNLSLTVPVWCDDGWMVIQRRKDGSVEFNRTWDVYARGFGKPTGDFWLGLDIMHELTKDRPLDMIVDMGNWDDVFVNASYANFTIESAADNYIMNISYVGGSANDSLAWHSGYPFTTYDRDNDIKPKGNCAQNFGGGWWHIKCGQSNLNGPYQPTWEAPDKVGIRWKEWLGTSYSLKFAQMKVRP